MTAEQELLSIQQAVSVRARIRPNAGAIDSSKAWYFEYHLIDKDWLPQVSTALMHGNAARYCMGHVNNARQGEKARAGEDGWYYWGTPQKVWGDQ